MPGGNRKSVVAFLAIFFVGMVVGWLVKPVQNEGLKEEHLSSHIDSNAYDGKSDLKAMSMSINRLALAVEQQSKELESQQRLIDSAIGQSASPEFITDLINEAIANQSYGGDYAPSYVAADQSTSNLSAVELPVTNYESVISQVNSQIQDGVWSLDDSQSMSKISHEMSPEQRANLEHQIIQAINDGQLVVEDISMPLF